MSQNSTPVVYMITPVTDIEFDIFTKDVRIPKSSAMINSIAIDKLFNAMTMITELLADEGYIVQFEVDRVVIPG